MTMGKWKLCVRWSACRGSPSTISLTCYKQENRPSWRLFPFRMATVLPLRTAWIADILSQASLRDVERQRCSKRGSGDGQRWWDYDTTERSFNAVSALCIAVERRGSTLTWTVCKAIGGSRYTVERQIFVTCLFAERFELCLCLLPSCAMYKDNVVAEMGRDLVFMTTIRLSSDLSISLKGEVQRSPEQSAWQPMARSGKFLQCASSSNSRRALGCEETTVLCSHRGARADTSAWEGVAGRGEIWVVRGDKHNPRKSANCKAQISTMCGVNDTDLCVAICRFSQVVFVTSNNFTHNLLFYIQ